MADSTYQEDPAEWIRSTWMAQQYGQVFKRQDHALTSGGKYNFAAVSADRSIVAIIATGESRTEADKVGQGKLDKVRSGVLFLTMAKGVSRRLYLFTQIAMWNACRREQANGRMPPEVEFQYVPLPTDLADQLAAGRQAASEEVTPARSSSRRRSEPRS